MSEDAVTKPCPHCGEAIRAVAIKCRFCGMALNKQALEAERTRVRGPEARQRLTVSLLWAVLLGGGLCGALCLATYQSEWGRLPGRFVLPILSAIVALVALVWMGLELKDRQRRRWVGIGFWWVVLVQVGWLVAFFVITPNLYRPRGTSNYSQAIFSLKSIGTAQSLFRETDREGDGNLDYGTLEELANGHGRSYGLIDSVLGSGTKYGYLFECTYAATTSEFLWFATATPVLSGTTGDTYFATNHEGVIFYTTQQPFRLNAIDCTIPSTLMPIGH